MATGFGAQLFKAGNAPQELVTCIHPSSDGTRLGKGDIVKLSGGIGSIANGPRVPNVIRAASGDRVYGVVVGTEQHTVATGVNLNQTYCPASTAMYLHVRPINHDDIYAMQEDAVGGSVAAADLTKNANFVVANCSTTTGMSGTMLDSSSAAATNTLDLRMVGVVDAPNNTAASTAKILVQFNKIQATDQIVGV